MMLMNNFSIIVRYSKVFAERKLQEYELGLPEQIIIMYLSSIDKVNQDTIAKHFMIDKGAIAKTLNKLENKGLIYRSENKDNKREKLISISEKGKTILEYMGKILEEWNQHLTEDLNEEDIQNMQRISKIMAANAIRAIENDGGYSYDQK